MEKFIFYVFFVVGILPIAFGLRCHRCISWECDDEAKAKICESMKEFVRSEIPKYFLVDDHHVPTCPPPTDSEEAWEGLKIRRPSSISCGGNREACTVGRFQVKTEVLPSGDYEGINFTSHGTVFGCAKEELLAGAKERAALGQCSIYREHVWKYKMNTRHTMDIENCETDNCKRDFCLFANKSVVLKFRGQGEVKNPMKWIFGFLIIFGLAVGILTILGIKYDR